ncbi:DFP2-like protein [Euroglyphus maynei]|uniref:DFP2-like protein n=1 Tax=Euroglyphus maynei TaxID=6958 RepID=A0A1Y3BN21_EURMA|nr:DFP2-like protein [Euroglyphus maynei]
MLFYNRFAYCLLAIAAIAILNVNGQGSFDAMDGQFKEGGSGRERIQAAVQTKHTVEMKPVDIPYEDIEPQVIEVEGGALPLEIHFKSSSSRIRVHQTHEAAGAGEVEQTSSEEEPHRLIHEVKKPIIQEVREIITPYRKVVQEIQPVMEEIHTIVAKGEARRNFDRTQTKTRGSRGSLASPSARAQSASSSGSSTSPF